MLGIEVLTRICGSGISGARALATDVSEAREKAAVSLQGSVTGLCLLSARFSFPVCQCERGENPRASRKCSRG